MLVTFYVLAEHLLQLALAHIGAEIGSTLESLELVAENIREHLLNEHLLGKELTTRNTRETLSPAPSISAGSRGKGQTCAQSGRKI